MWITRQLTGEGRADMAIRTEAQFNELEREWSVRMAGRSLVVEAEISATEAIEALDVLGQNVAAASGQSARERLLARYPAILTAGLCAIGSTHYDAGSFWPHVPNGLRVDAIRQGETGRAFQVALKKHGLSRFTTPFRYVGEILMHAGVPVSSVAALVHTLVRWDDGHTAGDAIGFIRWASSMSQAVATTRGFDVPTYRFLTEGGEIAEDFVNRLIAAIDDPGALTDLPAEIAAAVGAALEGITVRGNRARRNSLNYIPALTYHEHHGVSVRLPPLEAEVESALTWTVSTGGEIQRILVPAPWPGDPIEPKWAPVRAPQQAVALTLIPGDQRWELPLVDAGDPLLVFSAKGGELIPERSSLPKDAVWLAFPADGVEKPENLLEVDGELVVAERGGTPHGWHGWAFIAVNAAKFRKVRLATGVDRWRYVTTVDRPSFVGLAQPLSHLTTPDGDPVLPVRPLLSLPGPRTDHGRIEWVVTVVDAAGSEVSRRVHHVTEPTQDVEIWDGDDPLLGQFTVTVRGPLGRGATLRVAIAEQVEVSADSSFRWITQTGAGLESATISIISAPGDAPMQMNLGSRERSAKATLRRGSTTMRVLGAIPHLAVGFADSQKSIARIAPLLVDIEGLPKAKVRVSVPAGAKRVVASAVWGNEVLQTLDANGSWGSTSRTFDLSALSGTLASRPAAELRVVVDETSAPIAFIRPRRLADSVAVTNDGLFRIHGRADVAGLTAYFYPEFARWREPYRLEIPDGLSEVALPDDIRREGRAVTVLNVDNPWVREAPPKRPERSSPNAFSLKVGVLVDSDKPSEKGFRHWLAGVATCPSNVESLPVAIQLYSLLGLEENPETADRMRTELAESVRANRTSLLGAILESSADLDDLMRLLVEADVVTVPREDWKSSDALWSLAPGLGVIADSDELGGAGEPEFRAHLESSIGVEGSSILDDGVDPALAVGKFDPSIMVLSTWSEDELEDLFRAAGVVPKTLLDSDSRASASKQLLLAIRRPAIKTLRAEADKLVELSRQAIEADFGSHAAAPLVAREYQTPGGTGNLPTISLGLAMLARASARSRPQSSRLYEYLREGFVKLAAEAPRIVHQDLALAELWITRWEAES